MSLFFISLFVPNLFLLIVWRQVVDYTSVRHNLLTPYMKNFLKNTEAYDAP